MLTCFRATLLVAALAALPAAAQPGFRGEYLTELTVTETRMLQLADAIPAAKYAWRPAAGVRSISEVFLHVAAANYNLPKLIGTPPPAGFTAKGYDTSTKDKAEVMAALKDSFAHVRKAVENMPDSDGDKKLPWFGGENTRRGILFFMTRHSGEHLGQAIAYARMNGVAPPWSEEPKR